MKNIAILLLYVAMVYSACSKKAAGSPNPGGGNDTGAETQVINHVSVLTQHNDNTRAGLNNMETVLTKYNVNPRQFGKLFTLAVDDQVYAQPLVVANLAIGGSGVHDAVFVATVNNTVYAFDGKTGIQYWQKNFTVAGMRPPHASDMNSGWCTPYTDFYHNIGIVGTPVIDSAAQTMYFVARSTDGSTFVQYLHAISILSGAELAGSPVAISAAVAGSGDGSLNDTVRFDPMRNNQRQGLTLVSGVVYITYSSHCDWNPYHGWIIGYDARTLQQLTVFNDTPNGENGGIWESGMGMAADDQGNLYITTGNGTVGQGNLFSPSTNGTNENMANPNPADLTDRAESALKLTPSGPGLQVSSFFTPMNYLNLNMNDLDYGVMGTLLIPASNYYVTGCKDGNLYLLNKDNMGGFSSAANMVQQTVPLNVSLHCQPAYYKGTASEFVYVWSENDQLRALPFVRTSNTFGPNQLVATDNGPTGGCGADLSVSSYGANDSTGIVWAAYASSGDAGNAVSPGILRAFDASNITREIWNSNMTSGDNPGSYAKFCSATIANAHVYLATFSNQIVVYGLK